MIIQYIHSRKSKLQNAKVRHWTKSDPDTSVTKSFKAISALAVLLMSNRKMYLHNLLKGQIWRTHLTD
jgi:hypothetical protein